MGEVVMNKKLICVAVLASLSAASYATDYTWTGASDNNWSNTANWAGGALPAVNTDGEIYSDANNVILQDNAANSPALNVPKYALYGGNGGTKNPGFILGAGTALAIEAGVDHLNGDSGIDRAGQVATVGTGASLTFIKDNNMTLTRDPNGTGVYTVNGGVLNFQSKRLDFGFNKDRLAKFELDAGTVNLYSSSRNWYDMPVYGTRFGQDADTYDTTYSLVTLTNGSFFNMNAYFANNMTDKDGDGTVVFDLQDVGSSVKFRLNSAFSNTAQVVSDGFGVNFKSSTFGDNNLRVTEDNNFATVTVIPEPAALGLIGSIAVGMIFVRRRFMI